MPLHDYYYDAKPFIPWNLRMLARRVYLSGRRRKCHDVWPIKQDAGRAPADWPGWPNGKKFAFVLTHDVEGANGFKNCEQLMRMELALGFRSCFNFIPEGEYLVTPEIRALLGKNDFEVGVHDLYHDGKLYRSRRNFRRSALLINKYLEAWDAVGFRSGFMHHNLEWLHDLNIAYDCSTFDTDPFEPQPDGVGTIFPFWVEAGDSVDQCFSNSVDQSVSASVFQSFGNSVDRSTETPAHRPTGSSADRNTETPVHRNTETPKHRNTGYLELPYTLPQDSTLFLLFNQRSIDTWKTKLDWIASRGGMALLNVHPDYLDFESKGRQGSRYPASFYSEFLTWVRARYAGQYWHATPREVAAHCSPFRPQCPRPHRRICMLTHSYYRTDARVTRYAEALAARGDHVDVLGLSASPDAPRTETISGVNLVRLQKRYGKREKSRIGFLLPILRFLITGAFWIARSHRREPYDLLHIHNIPDFLVFAGWLPKRAGAKVILDIHDIVPEFYASKFNRPASSWGIKVLKFAERLSARVADHVIIANDLWLHKYATRTGKNGDCSVFINNVDTGIFGTRPRTRADNKTIILFPGGLQWHQGLDIAIRAFAKVLSTLNSTSGFSPQPSGLDSESSGFRSQPSGLDSESSGFRSQVSGLTSAPPSTPKPLNTETPSPTETPKHRNTEPPSPTVPPYPGSTVPPSPTEPRKHRTTEPPFCGLSTLNPQLSTSLEFHIYGDGNMKPQLVALAKELGLEDKVLFFDPLSVRQISDIMANADLGVVPKRADSFGNEAYSTKIMEFMALGVPVVVSSTKIDRFYFNESVVRFFPSGDHDAMAVQILDLLTNPTARAQQITNALDYAKANSWDNRKHDYLTLVDSLIDGQPVPPSHRRTETPAPPDRSTDSPVDRNTVPPSVTPVH